MKDINWKKVPLKVRKQVMSRAKFPIIKVGDVVDLSTKYKEGMNGVMIKLERGIVSKVEFGYGGRFCIKGLDIVIKCVGHTWVWSYVKGHFKPVNQDHYYDELNK